MKYPWIEAPLDAWAIAGMNHYHQDGTKMLFVSMTKDGHCITAEGPDNWTVWNSLAVQASNFQSESEAASEIADSYNAALSFVLDELDDIHAGTDFLEMWRAGCWPEIAEDFPNFDLSTATPCGYVA